MPIYKGVYYADGSEPMSAAAISAAMATSIGDSLESIGDLTLGNATGSTAWGTTPAVFEKIGRLVVAGAGGFSPYSTTAITNSFTQVGTVPAGFRPRQNIVVMARVNNPANFEVQILTSGAIQVRTLGGTQSLNTNSFLQLSGYSWIAA